MGNPSQTFRARERLGIEAMSLKLIYNHLSGFFFVLPPPPQLKNGRTNQYFSSFLVNEAFNFTHKLKKQLKNIFRMKI